MPPKNPTKLAPRKLLVAAVGVATLNYIATACTPSPPTSGNLPAPTAEPTNIPPTAGNLPAPPPVDAAPPKNLPPTSGNLPAPPPPDAGAKH